MKTLDLSALSSEAWRPIEPITGRASNRITERELEKITAWISILTTNKDELYQDIPVSLCDYSPFGFAIQLSHSKFKMFQVTDGAKVCLKLLLGTGTVTAVCSVKNICNFKNGSRIGLSRQDFVHKTHGLSHIGVPEGEFLRLPQHINICAETSNPILFGEWSSLTLYGLRLGLGVEVLSTDPALPLFIGQRLPIHLALPSSGSNIYEGEIVALVRQNGHAVRVRLKPVSISAGLANDLAEMLTFEAGISPETLNRYGFPVRFFRNRLTFRFVDSMDDYKKVLILRRNAYVDIGKRDQATTPEDMAIGWDKISRILCAYHDETLVACAGMTFPSSSTDILRSETAFPGNKFPGNVPLRTELLEVNCLCTHKDYRRGDLLKAIFEHLARIFILSDRNFIMNLSDDSLLPIYLGIGFKDMHETGIFLGRNHHLIKISRSTVTCSKGLGLLSWNMLYGDLMQDVLEKKLIAFKPWEKVMLKLRLSLKPIAKKLLRSGQEKKFQRMVDKVKNG